MKRLIVNADDFGLTAGVNRAVIECHGLGAVTSTTLLVNGQAAAEAARLAAANPGLGVGLHVNLTSGEPTLGAGRVPSLTEGGVFPGLKKMLVRLSAGLARTRELEAEIAAQIERCRLLGIEPTHMDSHHHLHAHPRVRGLLKRLGREYGIGKARGFRMEMRSPKAAGIRLAAMIPTPGITLKTPDRFSGIEAMGSKDMAAALSRELARSGGTLEFMCHPGYADAELSRISSYSSLRQTELEALSSGGFLAAARAAGAELISFREL